MDGIDVMEMIDETYLKFTFKFQPYIGVLSQKFTFMFILDFIVSIFNNIYDVKVSFHSPAP